MIKIGTSASNISVYTCQPKDKFELKEIIQERINKEGPECDLNDIDTSLINDMSFLFYGVKFNGDISNWNISNVKNMAWMFYFSNFNGNIIKWDVSNVKNARGMFYKSKLNQPIGDWNVSNIENMYFMFCGSNFNQDISNWKINKNCSINHTFDDCPIKEEFKPETHQQNEYTPKSI